MLDAVTLDQMRVFVSVAETGSFRSTAKRLARVQSAISYAIANLESQLGVTLFDRSGHRPALTTEGQSLLADVRAILLKVDAMRARARGLGEGVELSLSIVVDTLFPIDHVTAALKTITHNFPGVAVQVSILPLGGPPNALIEERATVGIIAGADFRHPAIEMQALLSFPVVAVAAANHALAAYAIEQRSLTAIDLTDHLQIVLEDPTLLSEGRDFGVLSPGTWRVNTQQAKHDFILAGHGWGRLPAWLVEKDLAQGRLVRLPTPALGPDGIATVQSYLARRIDVPMGPVAQAFSHTLLSQCL